MFSVEGLKFVTRLRTRGGELVTGGPFALSICAVYRQGDIKELPPLPARGARM